MIQYVCFYGKMVPIWYEMHLKANFFYLFPIFFFIFFVFFDGDIGLCAIETFYSGNLIYKYYEL